MLVLAALLLAQTAPAQCAAIDTDLPAVLGGWLAPAAAPRAEPRTTLTLGKDSLLMVAGPPKVTEGTSSFAFAEADFRIERAGVYSVALDQKGWIDLYPAAGGDALKSESHREGAACWSIRKIVRFELQPGAYKLSVKNPPRDAVKVMIVEGEGAPNPPAH